MMKTKTQFVFLCFVSWFALFVYCDFAYGRLKITEEILPPVKQQVDTEYDKTIATLRGIIQSMEALQEQVNAKEKAIQVAGTEEQKTRIVNEINELTKRLETLERDFESIATGIDLETFTARPRKSFDWKEEIQDVLGPIIEELKRVTARPREIERLRSEVAFYEKRLPLVKSAIKNVNLLKAHATTQELKNQLTDLEKSWIEKEKEIANQLVL